MTKPVSTPKTRLLKSTHPSRPERDYFLIEPDRRTAAQVGKPRPLPRTCDRPCTAVITLLPKTTIPGQTGIGYFMINVDGFRWINAYVISDALTSTSQRGFSLDLSFSVNPFVYGVGVVGESNFFFSFDSYYDPGTLSHRTVFCETNDLTSTGGLPRIGGVDLTHCFRVPVFGPYVRASAFNEDTVARDAQVVAYLST